MKPKHFKIIAQQNAYRGFMQVEKYQLQHTLFEGGMSTVVSRELMVRRPAVGVLPYDPVLKQIVLVEQFRVGAIEAPNPWLIEICAGLLEANESETDLVKRELKEETGLSTTQIKKIYEYYSSPGGSNETVSLYVAKVDAKHAAGIFGEKQEQEDIRSFCLDLDTAFAWLDQNKLSNALTIIAIQWLALHHQTIDQIWN